MKLAKNLENLGTESAFSVLAEAKALEAKGNPMIHMGLGQPDFKTPKHVVEAAKKALDDGHHGYVMSNGIQECRKASYPTNEAMEDWKIFNLINKKTRH